MAKAPVASVSTMDETQKADLYAKIDAWHKAKNKAAEWTTKERELRDELFSTYFPDPKEGTNSLRLDYGKVLKVVHNISRKPEKEQLEALLIAERAKVDSTGMNISNILPLIDTVIAYDPRVSVSEWKKLSDDQRKLLAEVVTEKPGAPTMSIETPAR